MKKLISILLALFIAGLCFIPAFAQQDCDCGHTPLVLVSGMNTYPLMIEKGTANEKQVFPPNIDVKSIVLKAVPGLFSAAVYRDWNKFGDVLIPLAYDLFEPSSFSPDGTSKYNVTTSVFPKSLANYPDLAAGGGNEFGLLHTACDKLGADHTYFFNYDWRRDPFENAADLNNFIENVKAETRHSKVDIAACSLGASQTMAYLYKYGTDDLESCVFLSPMLSGAYVASECMTGKIEVDSEALIRYLKFNTKSKDGGKSAVTSIMEVLNTAGLLKPILNILNKGIDSLYGRISAELINKTFAAMPGLWSAVRDDAYETAKQNLLDKTKNAELIKKIDSFHYNVRLKTKEIINNAINNGVCVAICSHYNTPALPLFESAGQTGDGVLDTFCTSGGAACAPIGKTLPADYIQKNAADGKHYISPDNIIDASTCLFPDKVWFFKNIRHVGCPYGSEYNEFIFWLLEQDEQPTVWTDSRHPQFSATNNQGKTLDPVVSGSAP